MTFKLIPLHAGTSQEDLVALLTPEERVLVGLDEQPPDYPYPHFLDHPYPHFLDREQ